MFIVYVLLLIITASALSVAFILKPNAVNPTWAILSKLEARNTLSTRAFKLADCEYAIRSQLFGFDSDESIREALQKSGTIVLDVRTNAEILKSGRLTDLATFPSHLLTYVQSDCTPTDCYTLRTSPQTVIPSLKTSTASIVIYCASGRRATLAKELLVQHGYQGNILNAGGFNDVRKFFEN